MENKDSLQIYKTLLECGCCRRCILRFLGDVNGNFTDPNQSLKPFSQEDNNGPEEVQAKRFKENICTVCLGLLQDFHIEELLSADLSPVYKYDCDNFVNFVSFPKAVMIRQYSMEVYLKEKFPEYYKDHVVLFLNKAWSWTIKDKLSKKLDKPFKKDSKLLIQFNVNYQNEDQESKVMFKCGDNFRKYVGKNDILSRNAITEFFENVDQKSFKQHVTIPPKIPTESVKFEKIICTHEPIYLAGRYCKYSRTMGQSPWITDNVRVVEGSVQEIIFDAISKVIQCKEMTFSSSGREDFNVRMLGDGRPFYIKISDPENTKIPAQTFRNIEKQIKKTKLVAVNRLQVINKSDLNVIKKGEEHKRKIYQALCVVEDPTKLASYIEKINSLQSLTLAQKTPVRVFHRRSCGERKKEIYSLNSAPVPGREDLFIINVETQAGTYVKEFVHGDLGRTKPSLCKILGCRVDIVALDVLKIDLDFPPSIEDNK